MAARSKHILSNETAHCRFVAGGHIGLPLQNQFNLSTKNLPFTRIQIRRSLHLLNQRIQQLLLLSSQRHPLVEELLLLRRQLDKIPLAKNCATVMPKAAQIASNVGIEGTVLRLKIFEMVDCDKSASLARRYSVQLCICIYCLILSLGSIWHTSFLNIL